MISPRLASSSGLGRVLTVQTIGDTENREQARHEEYVLIKLFVQPCNEPSFGVANQQVDRHSLA